MEEDCGGTDYNNQDDWKIRAIIVGLQCLYSFSNSQCFGFLCSILILDELVIYHSIQFCIWDFFQIPSPLFFLVSWFSNVAAELLSLERFFTCCKGWSFQENCCQHKHRVRFWAFTEQNMMGGEGCLAYKTEEKFVYRKTLAEYLRDRWSSKDISYKMPGGKWEDEERKENWSSQSSGSPDVFWLARIAIKS